MHGMPYQTDGAESGQLLIRDPNIRDVLSLRHQSDDYPARHLVDSSEQIYATVRHSMGSSGVVYVGHESGAVDVLDASTLEGLRPALSLQDGAVRGDKRRGWPVDHVRR
jgi:hypothetical protein